MRKFLLGMAALLSCGIATAQVPFSSWSISAGDSLQTKDISLPILANLDIRQDPDLGKMLLWHINNNKKRDGMEGFRVEIFFSSALNAKDEALRQKRDFLSKYPDYPVHIKFTAPNFRVRVGDFRTKNEALKLYKQIEKDYPGAFIVPDIIDFPLLKPKKDE
ncbi:MAG: SPOR domain-containing protein [Bacteroidales bacterium]|jgi:hypothetical protein|nr:SPOR domain-containing protein [Bacteroidales bacterium]